MKTLLFAMILMTAGEATAQQAPMAPLLPPPSMPAPLAPPSSAGTSHGPGLIGGGAGGTQSVIIPGSPVPGTLYNNGNGTSTIIVPGGGTELVPTPR